MASEVRHYTITIPAGTPKDARWYQDLDMPPRIVREIEIIVPPGPRGTVGFAIGSSGQPVIPRQTDEWIVTDDEKIRWPFETGVDSGGWQLFGWNAGTYDHTIYLRFLVDPVTQDTGSPYRTPLQI